MVHTRMVVRLFNTPSVPAGMRFSMLQELLRFKGEFSRAFEKNDDRMPIVLSQLADQWPNCKLTDVGKALEELKSTPDDAIAFPRVNARRSNT